MNSSYNKLVKQPFFKPQTNPQFFSDDEPLPKLKDSNLDSLNNYFASEPFKLELKALHKTIKLKNPINEFPLLLSLKSLDPFKLENGDSLMPYIDLVLVIDHSGSMEGIKLIMVKNTIKALLGFLRKEDRISVVMFDDKAARLTPLIRLTEENMKEINRVIDSIEPDGGTNIHLGLEFALEILRRRKLKNSISSVLLLSDGLDEESLDLGKSVIEKISIEGHFTINTFGFGDDHDSKLMMNIANLKGGSFYYIDKVDIIEDCFIDCLGGLLSIIGINLLIELEMFNQNKFIEEIKIEKFFGDGVINEEKNKLRIKASHLIAGTRKDFVVILRLSKLLQELQDHEKNFVLAIARLSLEKVAKNLEKNQMIAPVDKISLKSELNITVLNNEEEVKDYEKDEEVEVNFLRVLAAEELEKAQKDAEVGDYEKGKKRIEGTINKIKNAQRDNNQEVQSMMSNLEKARMFVAPKVFENQGKHYMTSYSNNFNNQQSHPMSNELNCNMLQTNLLKAVRSKKK